MIYLFWVSFSLLLVPENPAKSHRIHHSGSVPSDWIKK
ncbi:hypothetical protein SLEP1_g12786 [Rubroshorea leprosula]|uniref:Uncharacterized protein n=1 Tax=Rubroshorea leprosula TaxID=152421 RepID=A0AAV5IQ02_9ROSI|nr:hypothetical protein SLEP1_g12786 [Rubroshorea leprosula]